MAKKKDKSQVINNIQELNLEIDYDKFAEAITKKLTKQQEKYSPSREWMKYLLTPIFWGIGIFSGVLSIVMLIVCVQAVNLIFIEFSITNCVSVLLSFMLTLFTLGFSVFPIVTAKEIMAERDRAYIATVFSNMVAFAALIVALVALFKGVG